MTLDSNAMFNTPLELGIRCLVLLSTFHYSPHSLQNLINLDYLLLHLNDLDSSLESLHPSIPYRSSEIALKRKVMQLGLQLVLSRGLIEKKFSKQGIIYIHTKLGEQFIYFLKNDYHLKLLESSKILSQKLKGKSEIQIENFIKKNISRWGSEFVDDSYLTDFLEL